MESSETKKDYKEILINGKTTYAEHRLEELYHRRAELTMCTTMTNVEIMRLEKELGRYVYRDPGTV